MIFEALLEPHEYEETIGAALCRVQDPVSKMALYDPCWDFFHKFKISKQREFEFVVATVLRYGTMTETWNCLESGVDGLTSYSRIQDS